MRTILAAGAVGAWSVPALAPLSPRLARALGIPRTIATAGAVAVTFDDGPHPEGTPAMLEVLAANNAKATFFMVGEQVLRSPALAREVVDAGHAVAIHGHRHRNLLRLPPAVIRHDLDRADHVIAHATGEQPKLHRAPYGIYSWPALKAVRDRGWTPFLWSRWGRDWTRHATPHVIAHAAGAGVKEGDVLLLHDADDYCASGSWRRTAAALPFVLDAIFSAGLSCAALGSGR